MRRIIAFDRVSADGYFAVPNGDLSWAVPEPTFEQGVAAGMSGPGTMLFGRRTYEAFESFWPNVKDEGTTAPDPHAPGRHAPALLAMARWINEGTKVVFSRTRADVTWNNSRLHREIDADEIRAMKDAPGGDMMIFGSGTVVSRLAELGLVDEFHLMATPVLLGGGRPLVSGLPARIPLTLLEATPYPQGNVMLRYAPARQA
jgi:dihydrofolate reductase